MSSAASSAALSHTTSHRDISTLVAGQRCQSSQHRAPYSDVSDFKPNIGISQPLDGASSPDAPGTNGSDPECYSDEEDESPIKKVRKVVVPDPVMPIAKAVQKPTVLQRQADTKAKAAQQEANRAAKEAEQQRKQLEQAWEKEDKRIKKAEEKQKKEDERQRKADKKQRKADEKVQKAKQRVQELEAKRVERECKRQEKMAAQSSKSAPAEMCAVDESMKSPVTDDAGDSGTKAKVAKEVVDTREEEVGGKGGKAKGKEGQSVVAVTATKVN